MRWSKIKNIILLLLVMVNLCLLSLVGVQTLDARRQEQETRARMLTVLERSGVEFLPGELPGELPLTGRKLRRVLPGEAEAEVLLGGLTDVVETETETIRIGPRGSMTVSDSGRAEVRFSEGALPLDGVDAGDYGADLLSELDGVTFREWDRKVRQDELEVRFVQLWSGKGDPGDGYPIPQMTVTLTFLEDELRLLEGQWLMGTEEPLTGPGTGKPVVDGVTALARFLELRNREGYVCARIRGMAPGYVLDQGTSVTLRPTWFLMADTWPWYFAVDGWTGEAVPYH